MDELKPTRRKRYSGKYPKSFSEKYKERQPSKYQDIIAHVIEKGNTPAGMHRPIMVTEIISFLDILPNQIGLDATLGFGGHSKAILEKLNHTGHLHAIDIDPIELPKTDLRLKEMGFTDKDFTLYNLNFKDLDKIPVDGYDFIIADLGVSSMQIDDPERGFTYKFEGPLDLRMNPNIGISASERINKMTQAEIESMLEENGDEPYAREIASEIVKARSNGLFMETTKDLQEMIYRALSNLSKSVLEESLKKSSQRTFQALRIDVNKEYEALYEFLEKVPNLLKKNGKVAILSFHSGEDRLVKKFFQHCFRNGIYSQVFGPELPSQEEVGTNPRSRSAKLRCAIRD
jgi:16S rRNA (cytosine1402-N4)-methyltransferase